MLNDAIETSLALSPEQRALISLWGSEDKAGQATAAVQLRIEELADCAQLQGVAENILEAHQLLGTALCRVPGWRGLRWQRLQTIPNISWHNHDMRDGDDADSALPAWIEQFRRQPLAIERGELLKFGLVRVDEYRHVLVLVACALAVDRAGLMILARQIVDGYCSHTAPDPDSIFHYSQFLEWRQSLEEDEDALLGKAYWKNSLRGDYDSTSPRLGSRRDPAVAPASDKTLQISRSADSRLTQSLQQAAESGGCAVETLLQGAWWLLLARLTGFDTFIAGWLHDCRQDYPIMADAVGVFEKILPLVVDIDADMPFAQWLQTLAGTLNDHIEAQEYCAIDAEEVLAHFNTGFSFYAATTAAGAPHWQVSAAPGFHPCFELALHIDWSAETAGLLVQAKPSCYSPAALERLLEQYLTLLQSIVSTPHAPVSQLTLVSEREYQALLSINGGRVAAGTEAISGHVAAWARKTPRAAAIELHDRKLSYRELDASANQMAHWLIRQGIAADMLVAVILPRSPELIVAILAIWRAGAGYVPLQPDWPAERRLAVLSDAQPAMVIDANIPSNQVDSTPWRHVAWAQIDTASLPATAPQRQVALTAIAYVLYTSGSTGKPKGVLIEHRHLLNYVTAASAAMHLDSCRRWALVSPVVTDIGNTALFGGLFNGACLVVADSDTVSDAGAFSDFMRSRQIDSLKIVPSHLQALLETDTPYLPATLILGGEAPAFSLIERIEAINPQTVIYNHYGPTETTVGVIVHKLHTGADSDPIPLTRVLANNSIYILDGNRQLVPSGGMGEVYIGGAQVCRGYLHLDREEAFADNPLHPGERLYRSGDLAYVLPEGGIRLTGRADQQVKIRGYRVEPVEVESLLQSLPGIKNAAVLAVNSPAGDSSLAAFVLPEPRHDIEENALRERLSALLPSYMVPLSYVFLAHMPLLANGKVDRAALLASMPEQPASRAATLPRNELEGVIADCMAALLKRDTIDIEANFFHLGAHSLLVIKLAARLRKALAIELAPSEIFDFPTVAELAEHLGERAAERAASEFVVPQNGIVPGCKFIAAEMVTLIKLTPQELRFIEQSVPGGAANIQDIYPLVPLQEGILFHHLLDSGRDTFVTSHLLSFDTRARLERFVDSLNQVIARHDILRTAVLWENLSEPVQVVYREAELSIAWLQAGQLSGTGHTDSDTDSHDNHSSGAAVWDDYRIDVRKAPLLHCMAAEDRLNKRWLLRLFRHHLAADHTTLELQIEEVTLIQQGRRHQLPEPLPFRDFVARARLGADREAQQAFFRAMLADVDEPTTPFGLVNVQGDGSRIREARLSLTGELATEVRAQAQRCGTGAAAVFHLAWALVAGRYSGRDDVVFGTVLFGRMQGSEGSERAMGMFINTLPLRIKLQGQSVQQALQQTQAALIDLLRHEHASLALAQSCSAVSGGVPLFSTLLNYRYSLPQHVAPESSIWEGIQVLESEEHSNYPLTLLIDDLGTAGFNIVAQVSEEVDAQRVCASLQAAVAAIAEALAGRPEVAAGELDLLDEKQQRQLRQWGGSLRQYPGTAPVHSLFEQQVQRQPNAVALHFDQQRLSYAELNRRSNRLAHYLLALGVGPETRVGIAVERSIEMVVGLLGILKAGGAYVPLDPEYPPERLADMVEDSGVRLLLIQSHLRDQLCGDIETIVVLDAVELDDRPAQNPQVALSGDNLAYVIYTSGSTGKPKGVANRHRALRNRLLWMQEAYGLDGSDTVLQKTPFSFDVSVWEFFWPLLAGAQLALAKPGDHRDPARLLELIRRHQVTTLHFVPSMLQALLAAGGIERCASLRRIVCSGEALPLAVQNTVLQRLPQAALYNLYGPTEAAIDVTHWTCGNDGRSQVPIGRPISGIHTRVLDQSLNPAPIAVAGELYLGGIGLARGYLHRSALTAERFVADPGSASGGRLYRTGDRVRWLEDGQLAYLGRSDQQVKIRGFRVEPGEIEARLLAQPEVGQAVAVAQAGSGRLVAYITVRAGQTVRGPVLRERLQAVLPDYMVPSVIVELDTLPLTPNGKVNRKALPAPDFREDLAFEAPRGEVEQQMARIWAQVLDVERVGRNDNFFELGGHSLLALKLLQQMRPHGWSAAVRSLFQYPQLQAFAAAIERGDDAAGCEVPANGIPAGCEAIEADMLTLVELTPEEIRHIEDCVPGGGANIQDIYPLAPLQEGILFHHLLQTGRDAYLASQSIRFSCRQVLEEFVDHLNEVISRHDILRTAVVWEKLKNPLQVVYRDAQLSLQWLQPAPGNNALQQLEDYVHAGRYRMDVSRAPLIFALAAPEPERDGYLLQLAYHHLISDHTTLDMIVSEIGLMRRGRRADLPAPLPFRNFVAQARSAVSEAEHEAFFTDMLGDVDAPTAPFDTLDTRGDGSKIKEFVQPLAPALAQQVRRQVRRYGVSAATLFHLAWALAVARTSGRDDVVFGTVLFGRLQGGEGAERALGMFINTLPLRLRLQSLSASEALGHTHALLAGLLRHEHASLSLAQRCSALPRGKPLFSSLFNYRYSSAKSKQDSLAAAEGMALVAGRTQNNYPITVSINDAGGSFEAGDFEAGGFEADGFEASGFEVDGFEAGGFEIVALVSDGLNGRDICHYMHEAVRALTEALANCPQRRLREIDLLSAAQRDRLRACVAGDRRDFGTELVPSLVERWAQSQPHSIALCSGNTGMSYRQLDQLANAMAAKLIDCGVKAETRVAIHAPRSGEFVVALLAVLKAGGAYLPLDPALPGQRLRYQVRDSGAALLLSNEKPHWNPGLPVLSLNPEAYAPASPSPAVAIHPDQAAYVIYTSGSTGRPKGVVIGHAALANYTRALLQRLALPAAARHLAMVSTVAADLGHSVLFGALCCGRTLHLIPAELTVDADAFAAYMRRQRIAVLKIVPGHLQALLQAMKPADVIPSARLILGGETTDWALLERINGLKPSCRVLNHYGPTEATVGVLTQYAEQAQRSAATLPIGTPLANTAAYVLDTDLNLVPAGVCGELYLGGVQLARCYQSHPAQTAERLIANPFDRAQRLYRSGDRGKILADGSIVFLGRADEQIKLRGYRVEPREVARLLQHQPGVAEAAVVARETPAGETRLYGYVAAAAGAGLDTEALRQALAAVLPDYMLPDAVAVLDELPRTANGKLDRKALPDLQTAASRDYQPPEGVVEETLAAVWSEVLGVQRVGRHDNFFALGGDSILTLQIVARSRKQGLKILPKQLMELQTLAAIAAQLPQREAAALPHRPGGAGEQAGAEPFALTPIQRWFFAQNFAEPQHWNQSLLLTPAETPDLLYLRQAVEAVVAHHQALRLCFSEQNGVWQQSVAAADATVPFEHIDLSAEQRAPAAISAAADEAQRSLSLTRPCKFIWFDLGQGKPGRLLLLAHHLVVDAVSWRILLEDLQSAYRRLLQNQPPALPPPVTSLQQWSQALSRCAESGRFTAQLPYWQAVLEQREPDLPGRSEGSNCAGDASSVDWSLDEALTEQLLTVAPQAYRARSKDLLLTALARTLCSWSGHRSVRVELEGHGREELQAGIDLSRTAGWFTSLFPVRLTPGADLDSSIKAVKEQLRAVPDNGIGYGILRYLTPAGGQLAQADYPQVTFNYLGQFDQSFGAASLWYPARESTGVQRSPASARRTWLDISAAVHRGELKVSWTYSTEIHQRATIQHLSECFGDELRALIEHCSGAVTGVTPSDFPLAHVTQDQLDRLPLPWDNLLDLYALSPMQSGMLFHSVGDPHSSAYVNQLRIDLGGLDPQRFKASWQAVFNRHDTLRTGFIHTEQPLQWVARSVALPFAEEDWRGRQDLETALDDLARRELRRGFELAVPPLMRLLLVRVAAAGFHLIWTRHHLLLDGWSTSRLIAEVLAHYAGQNLPHLQGRYRDYIRWLQGRDLQASETYWRNLLRDLEQPTRLAAADPEADQSGYLYHDCALSAGQTAQLAAFARSQRVTLNTLVQAAWALLLRSHTGLRVVSFGATTASRPPELDGAESLLGLFINTLPVLAEPSPQLSVGAWLRDLQAQNLASREHEHTPLFDIQSWAGSAGQALFDSIIVFENYPVDKALRQSAGLELEVGKSRRYEQTNYPLTLVVTQGSALSIEFAYQGRYFDNTQVERQAAQLRRLLLALVQNADGRLADIHGLSRSEQRQLQQWGAIRQHYPESQPLHCRFQQRALQQPDRVAVCCGDEQLSYAALNRRANRLAHHLIALGVRPETRVGIAVERSLHMVVGLLAILKAGGAYVPLDPQYPAERLSYLIEDSGVALLLTQSAVRNRVPAAGLNVLELDTLDLQRRPAHNPSVAVHGGNLAYVIYTSGSSGKPKGALLCHHNASRLFCATEQWFGFNADDVWTLFHSYAFDFSVWELFGALCSGGRLVIVPFWISRSAEDLLQLLRDQRITVLNQTPSAFEQLLQLEKTYAQPLALRLVIFGGEALQPERLRPWIARWGDQRPRLINMYGITETTVHVTYRPIGATDLRHRCSPVGVAIPDLGLRVLDSALNPAPIGSAGELCVCGAGLARGYLNRRSLTAERFVADPGDRQGGRLYRTGDLARWRADGQLEYLGRIDQQVKIRGFRLEPGEVEAQLLAQPEVKAAVVALQPAAGGSALVGYVAARAGHTVRGSVLRERLANCLPDYMVPSAIVELQDLPLTPNGKVNRKALPAPAFAGQKTYQPPRGEVEKALAQIWSEVLQLQRVGRHDNFFELGGHSLLALQVLQRIRRRGWSTSVRTLLQCPELAALARALAPRGGRAEVAVPANDIPPGCKAIQPEMVTLIDLTAAEIRHIEAAVPGGAENIQDIYPLAPLQEGILFHHLIQTEGDAYITSHTLSFDSRARLEGFISGLEQVIARHDILRTAVLWENLREPVQVVQRQVDLPLQWLEVTAADVSGQLARRADPARYRIDICRAPMLRALAACDNGRWLLHLLSHHMIDDNTTLQHLVREIALLHENRRDQLPEPIPFRNFVARARLGVSDAEHEAFFTAMLGDVTELAAPFNLRDVRGDGSGIDEARLALAADLARQLRHQAQRYGVGAAALFHLAWALVVARTSGRDDVVFGTVLFGRSHHSDGAERALGLFINTLPLRIRLAARSVEQCLRQAHQGLIDLVHHEHARLALALRCSALPGDTPLFSSLLNYRHTRQLDVERIAGVFEGMERLGGRVRSNYPFGMSVNDSGSGFELVAQVDQRVGARRICAMMHKAVACVVAALTEQPDQLLHEIDLLADDERAEILAWGVNAACHADLAPVHRLFERRALQRPDATAVVSGELQLSYAELNCRANRLAHYLIARGVKPETRVGIGMERHLDMAVALLGTLKAGGAYVPLDPAYPQDRLAYIAEDSGIELLLMQSHLRKHLPAFAAAAVIELDTLDSSGLPGHNPQVALHGDNLAYVIYTSGSTGRPKGAANRHASLSSCLQWMQEAYCLTPADTVLHKAPFGFDVSVWESLLPLTAGARLALAGPGDHRDPARLLALIARHQVTIVSFVPAMLQALLAQEGIGDQTQLRYIACGGEAVPAALQRDTLSRLPGASLQNLYGPTETTIHVTRWTCVDDERRQLPIGRPITGIRAHVLDMEMHAVPQGVAGELYLGGVGLARGYLNRPALTADRFVADPFDRRGGRLYRTGDLVCWNGEGQLQYLGRIDYQIKIRGFRIELGEVEAQLLAQPEVKEAVAAAQQGPAGMGLAAYVVLSPGAVIDGAALRRRLGATLPDYMLPNVIAVLESLPLNANGKVDRTALPAVDGRSDEDYQAPRGEVEEALAQIWAEVLGVERVGRQDNFFALGGHSLAAMQVVAGLQRLCGLNLPLRDVFELSTLADLAGSPSLAGMQSGSRSGHLQAMEALLADVE